MQCHDAARVQVQAAGALLARYPGGPCLSNACSHCKALGHVKRAFDIMTTSPLVIGCDFQVLDALHRAFGDIKEANIANAQQCLEEAEGLLERFRA